MNQEAEAILERLCTSLPLGYRPSLLWKPWRVTAGCANWVRCEITLSSILLTDLERLESTLIHEYAHLLAVARHGRKGAGHGEPWKQAMRDLGAEPVVRHRYPVQRNARKTQAHYQCRRCGKMIALARRLPKRRRYAHVECGGSLVFQRSERITPQADTP